MENNSVWDEKQLDKLKKLWDEGLPITKIGLELGVSRNAIAGKAHRLGLPKEIHQFQNLGIQERTRISLILKQLKNFLSKFYLEMLSGLAIGAVGQLEILSCLVFLFVELQ